MLSEPEKANKKKRSLTHFPWKLEIVFFLAFTSHTISDTNQHCHLVVAYCRIFTLVTKEIF